MKKWYLLCLLLLSTIGLQAQTKDSLSMEALTEQVKIAVHAIDEQVQTMTMQTDAESLQQIATQIQTASQALSQLIQNNIYYVEEDQSQFSTYFVLALSDPDLFGLYYVNAMSHLGATSSYPMGRVLNTLHSIDRDALDITQTKKPKKIQRLKRDMQKSSQQLKKMFISKQ